MKGGCDGKRDKPRWDGMSGFPRSVSGPYPVRVLGAKWCLLTGNCLCEYEVRSRYYHHANFFYMMLDFNYSLLCITLCSNYYLDSILNIFVYRQPR